MSGYVFGQKYHPLGDPDDVRDAFRALAAEPGGNRVPIGFSDQQRSVLNAITDELIPPGNGFPAPSAAHVVDEFFTRYVTPSEAGVSHFPGATEDEFKAAVDAIDSDFLDQDQEHRVAALTRIESEQPEFFGQLRALTYAGYYSRPAVVQAMRENLDAARDYNGPPLPYGYQNSTLDWNGLRPPEDGSFTPTVDVQLTPIRSSSRP